MGQLRSRRQAPSASRLGRADSQGNKVVWGAEWVAECSELLSYMAPAMHCWPLPIDLVLSPVLGSMRSGRRSGRRQFLPVLALLAPSSAFKSL